MKKEEIVDIFKTLHETGRIRNIRVHVHSYCN